MITVTGSCLAEIRDQLCDEVPVRDDKRWTFDGHIDDFDGSAYHVKDDGGVFFRVFDTEEPNGVLTISADKNLRGLVKKIGLDTNQRIRVTVEVLP